MTMKLILAMILLAVPSQAEWRRQGYSGKGQWSDIATPHALSYFTDDPLLRDDANDFCIACTDEEKATLHLKIKVRAEVRPVGHLGGLAVVDVLYYFESKDTPDWKFVLVKMGSDEYREIVHVQGRLTDWYVGPTALVKAGQEWILNARASAGGNKGVTYGDYFWLGKDGPVMVELDEVSIRAGVPLVPRGKSIYGVVDVDFPTMTATLKLEDQKMWGCCSGDSIVVKFKLHQGKVKIRGARYVGPPSSH